MFLTQNLLSFTQFLLRFTQIYSDLLRFTQIYSALLSHTQFLLSFYSAAVASGKNFKMFFTQNLLTFTQFLLSFTQIYSDLLGLIQPYSVLTQFLLRFYSVVFYYLTLLCIQTLANFATVASYVVANSRTTRISSFEFRGLGQIRDCRRPLYISYGRLFCQLGMDIPS